MNCCLYQVCYGYWDGSNWCLSCLFQNGCVLWPMDMAYP